MTTPNVHDWSEDSQPDKTNSSGAPSAAAVASYTKLIEEHGRWVVFLNVDFWEPDPSGNPISTTWLRIADYPDRARAAVAAHWIEKSTDRNLRRPPTGL